MASRAQLELAFEHYQQIVRHATTSGDWTTFGALFTEDATYNEHAYGRMGGRTEIGAWATRTMTTFPGNCMSAFPVAWAVFDDERGWIVCEIRNLMADPGDGSAFEASNLTILHHAAGLLFSHEEDVYNPANFVRTVVGWAARADRLGTLPAEATAWLSRFAHGPLAPAADR